MRAAMTIEAKGKIIQQVLSQLKLVAERDAKPFDEGDTFLALAFKSDEELSKIARMCGA